MEKGIGMFAMLTREEYDTLARLADESGIGSSVAWMRLQLMGTDATQIKEIVARHPVAEAVRDVEFNRLCSADVKTRLVALAAELTDGSEAIVLRALLQKAIDEQKPKEESTDEPIE